MTLRLTAFEPSPLGKPAAWVALAELMALSKITQRREQNSTQSGLTLAEAKKDPDFWGRLTESAVGAHLAAAGECELRYWREKNREVDFVVQSGRRVIAIEVKSGRRRESMAGMAAFQELVPKARTLLVGGDGIPVEEFLLRPPEEWLTA